MDDLCGDVVVNFVDDIDTEQVAVDDGGVLVHVPGVR